ncbi:hypothetical protein QLX08_002017 [Tetragonisca angustula]|uniref:Uncharacterized protein n=1 Tax=Tetragonisca angustula TaxID=166442 RepID=A0AAW1AFZ5_9HYME
MTCRARRESFVPKLQYFYSLKAKQMINLSLLSNFYSKLMISCRRVRKESDELLYTVWPLVMVRNQLPAQVVEKKKGKIKHANDISPRYYLNSRGNMYQKDGKHRESRSLSKRIRTTGLRQE